MLLGGVGGVASRGSSTVDPSSRASSGRWGRKVVHFDQGVVGEDSNVGNLDYGPVGGDLGTSRSGCPKSVAKQRASTPAASALVGRGRKVVHLDQWVVAEDSNVGILD